MPDPALQSTALRYAAGDLGPAEGAAFEELLAVDQDARDALAEAVRLSAAALGQAAPRPSAAVRARLRERLTWTSSRGLSWAAGGGAAVAVCAIVGLALAGRSDPPPLAAPVTQHSAAFAADTDAPEPAAGPRLLEVSAPAEAEPLPGTHGDDRSVAEIWADLSSHEHVEKARDDEARWRQKVHNLTHPHSFSSAHKAEGP